MIKATTALRKLGQMKGRIWSVQGGQGAAKTFSILLILINHAAATSGQNIIIASEELSKMRLTVIKDFEQIMRSIEYFDPNAFLAGRKYTFPNGSKITFIGLDKDDIGKGLRSDVLFINEANKVSWETFREISTRAKRIIIDYNPNAMFWAHTELHERDDCETIVLTHEDNEHLSKEERAEIMRYKEKAYNADGSTASEYWLNKWRVYGLGLVGHLDGLVFPDIETVAAVPEDAELIGYGLDFGFTNDPTALIALYNWRGALVGDQLLYATNLTNPDIAERVLKIEGFDMYGEIIADNAEPKSITELQNKGLNVWKSKKGRDSINAGIDILKRYKIYLTERSKQWIDESRRYSWAVDRATGKATNKPVDKFNHAWDAARSVALFFLVEDNYLKAG